jgi:hypothetical protein
VAASPEQFDIGAKRAELASLLAEEREISTVRAQMHARIDSFPSPLVRAEARKLSKTRRDLQLRIDELRMELNLLTR